MSEINDFRNFEIPPDDELNDAHDPDQTLKNLVEKARFGKSIILELGNGGPLDLILSKARTSYVEAVNELTRVNLFTQEGIARARELQNLAARYDAMLVWIKEALAEHDDTVKKLHDEDLDENGNRRDH